MVLLIHFKNKNLYREIFCTISWNLGEFLLIMVTCLLQAPIILRPWCVRGVMAGLFFILRLRPLLLRDPFLVKWVKHGKGRYWLRALSLRLSFAQLCLDWNFSSVKSLANETWCRRGCDLYIWKMKISRELICVNYQIYDYVFLCALWRWDEKFNLGTVEMFECENNSSDWKCGSGGPIILKLNKPMRNYLNNHMKNNV